MAGTDTLATAVTTHVIEAQDEGQAILMMDRNDLDQALAELKGEVIEQFVYLAPARGGTPAKRQLTYAGVKEAARLYKNVSFGANASPLPDNSGWVITAWAHNIADNVRAEYPYPYPRFDPANNSDSIAFRATVSKAMRNALTAVLPVRYMAAMIDKWAANRERPAQKSPAAIQMEKLLARFPRQGNEDRVAYVNRAIRECRVDMKLADGPVDVTEGFLRTLNDSLGRIDKAEISRRVHVGPKVVDGETGEVIEAETAELPGAQNGVAAHFSTRLDNAEHNWTAEQKCDHLPIVRDEIREAFDMDALTRDEHDTLQQRAAAMLAALTDF